MPEVISDQVVGLVFSRAASQASPTAARLQATPVAFPGQISSTASRLSQENASTSSKASAATRMLRGSEAEGAICELYCRGVYGYSAVAEEAGRAGWGLAM